MGDWEIVSNFVAFLKTLNFKKQFLTSRYCYRIQMEATKIFLFARRALILSVIQQQFHEIFHNISLELISRFFFRFFHCVNFTRFFFHCYKIAQHGIHTKIVSLPHSSVLFSTDYIVQDLGSFWPSQAL